MKIKYILKSFLAVGIVVFISKAAWAGADSHGWFQQANPFKEQAPLFFVGAGLCYISVAIMLLALVHLFRNE